MAQRQLRSILTRPPEVDISLSREALGKQGFSADSAKALAENLANPGRVNILSDLPTQQDALGFTPVVRTLCNIVLSRSTETPITIAVDGQWGSGKTSILRMVETQARMVGFSCIWLNAWSLESAENLIAAIAHEIQGELTKRRIDDDTTSNKLFNFIVSALGYVSPVVEATLGTKVGALSKALNLKTTKQTIDSNVQEVASIVSSQQAFKDLVGLLLGTQTGPETRLLVFIDDVDRALPDQIATILKNLKLVLESDRCIFLLAMDINVVARAIEDHYLKNTAQPSLRMSLSDIVSSSVSVTAGDQMKDVNFGLKYLEKLVQLRVKVPHLARANLKPYLETLSIAPEIAEIVAWAPEAETLNPRRLKRFINWLSVSLQLVSASRKSAEIDNLAALQLLMLQRYYPRFYHALVQSPLDEPAWLMWERHCKPLPEGYSSERLMEFLMPLLNANIQELRRFITDNSLIEFDEVIPEWPVQTADTLATVVLTSFGDRKIEVIKEVRGITGLGLKEAKDLVEAAPMPVIEGISRDEAERIRTVLEKTGAKVEVF